MNKIHDEICTHLENGIIPFWLNKACDPQGGYLTSFNKDGDRTGETEKYIVTQARMIWGLSAMAQEYPDNELLLPQAKQGVDFIIEHFWDKQYGG